MNSKRKDYLVTIRDENYDTVKEFRVSPKHSEFVGNNYYLYIVIAMLFVICVVMFLCNASAVRKIETLKTSNKTLTVENTILHERCLQLEYALWDKKLHNVIGYYSIKPNSEINRDTLYSFLNEHSDVFLYPDVIYAQVVLESNAGKSVLYKSSNNLIGMTFPSGRETTAIGKTESGFAKYKNWQSCVLDRPLWDKAVFKNRFPTRDEYLHAIGRIYAEDPNYINSLEHIIDTDYNNR